MAYLSLSSRDSLVHSFIIDVEDPVIRGIFMPAEINEIESTNVKEEQELSDELYKNLIRYYDKVC